MSFVFEKQPFEDVYVIKPSNYYDNRGQVVELFRKAEFDFLNFNLVQINSSYSVFRTLRGLHFQKGEYAQSKIITVNRGSILDVVVDLRKHSSTFGKYLKFILSDENCELLYIPRGFAHGFVTLSDDANVTYFLDNYYNSDAQSGILWNDSKLGIDWEIEYEPILSDKDKNLPSFSELEEWF